MEHFLSETDEERLLKSVYMALQDEVSQEIYKARSLYSLTDDKLYLKNIVRNMTVSMFLKKQLEKHKDKKLVLFSFGTWGKAISFYFPEINWTCIIDNNLAGKTINGHKVFSFDKLSSISNAYIVIANLFNYQEIELQLKKNGFSESDYLCLGRIADERQYLDLPELNFSDKEVFVDVGAFNGMTSRRFANVVGNAYKHIYLFEPSKSVTECELKMSGLKNYTIIKKGCWNDEETLRFSNDGGNSSVCNESNDMIEISTCRLDDALRDKTVTYIKMDIEGAEMNALLGAEKIISSQKPKLAISIYHKREDIWNIPKLLLKYNSDYKFFLRVYSFTGNDTVLYAL